jgi:hypothetical protein
MLAILIFFLFKLLLELVSLGEFVGHLILVLSSLFLELLQFFLNSDFKDLNLLEVLLSLFLLNLQSGVGSLRVL